MSGGNDVLPLLNAILSRLSVIEDKIGSGGDASGSSSGSGDSSDLPKSIKAFDEYTAACLDPFVASCTKLGPGDIAEIGTIIKDAWAEMRAFLVVAAACKEPAKMDPALLAGLSSKMKAAGALVKRNEWEKHAKTCAEGISCLNWVVIKPAPRDFIESYIGGSDYWANGIRKEFRNVNADQIAFCDTFKALIAGLMGYVKEFHLTGVVWNKNGVDVAEFSKASASTPTSPVAAATPRAATAPSSGAPKGDLFASLNKGGAITSGLKTVTKDMQTWREEFKGTDAPTPVTSTPKPAPRKAETMKHPPKLFYNDLGSKWEVEYQTGPVEIEIKDIKETVYIYGCMGATIDVKGKCKSIVVDGCKKVTVLFDVAMASCEIVNCTRTYITCRDTVSAVAIDKTDGIVVTLPATSLHTEIVASKSSEMNVSFPGPGGEMIEKPIPEQYIHKIKNFGITADVSELYSS